MEASSWAFSGRTVMGDSQRRCEPVLSPFTRLATCRGLRGAADEHRAFHESAKGAHANGRGRPSPVATTSGSLSRAGSY